MTFSHVLSVGQGLNLMVSGGQTPYSLSSNTGSGIFSATFNGNILMLAGLGSGTGSVNICSSGGSCLPIYVTVVGASSQGTSSGAKYKFNNPIVLGDEGSEVSELQNRLKAEGVYSGSVTGYFGPLTEAAVKKYQKAQGLTQLGNVGPGTRAALNK